MQIVAGAMSRVAEDMLDNALAMDRIAEQRQSAARRSVGIAKKS